MNAASGEFAASEESDSWLADDTPRLDDYLRGQVGALLWCENNDEDVSRLSLSVSL